MYVHIARVCGYNEGSSEGGSDSILGYNHFPHALSQPRIILVEVVKRQVRASFQLQQDC